MVLTPRGCAACRQSRAEGAEPSRAAGSDLIIALCKASQPGAALRVFEDMTAAESAWGAGRPSPGHSPVRTDRPGPARQAAGPPSLAVADDAARAELAPAPDGRGAGDGGRRRAPVVDRVSGPRAVAAAARAAHAGGSAGAAGEAAPLLERPRPAPSPPLGAASPGVPEAESAAAAAAGAAAAGAPDARPDAGPAAHTAPPLAPVGAAAQGSGTGSAGEAATGSPGSASPAPGPSRPPPPSLQHRRRGAKPGARSGGARHSADAPHPLPQRGRRAALARRPVVPHLSAVGALVHGFACAGDLATAFRLYQQARPVGCAPWCSMQPRVHFHALHAGLMGNGRCPPLVHVFWCADTWLCFCGLQQGGQHPSFQHQMPCVVQSACEAHHGDHIQSQWLAIGALEGRAIWTPA
jgi:hypothetical protein